MDRMARRFDRGRRVVETIPGRRGIEMTAAKDERDAAIALAVELFEANMKSATNGKFRAKNLTLVETAIDVLKEEKPMTLRQLYYRLISAGALQNSQKEYARLGKVMTRLREDGIVPRRWIVDHVRSTLKPSSW